MILNKALIAAAVLLFTAPVVPALAHDDYGDRGYVRCLACPGSWRDHDGWRDRYRWRDHDKNRSLTGSATSSRIVYLGAAEVLNLRRHAAVQ